MKLSLGWVLILCFTGLQFFATLIVVMSSYITSERALLEHARGLLGDVAINTIEHSKGFVAPARGAAELATRLAENQIVASDNPTLLEKLLFQQLQIAPQFAGVFYGDEQGQFIYVMRSDGPGPFRSKIVTKDSATRSTELIWRNEDFEIVERRSDPDDAYDPRDRTWYQSARSALKTIWTDPYIFFTSREPGITVASPVFKMDGTVAGVIGVDINITAISEFLSRLKVGKSGKALILNRNGDVIAHPDPSLIKTENSDGTLRFLNIGEIKDPIARTAFGLLLTGGKITIDDEISSTFQFDNAEYVSKIKPVLSETLPWTIAVYAPKNDFIAGIKANRSQNIVIAAIVAALTAGIGLLFAGHIHKPIQMLALRATLISQGKSVPDEPFPKTFRELKSANDVMMREISRRKKSELEYGRTFELVSRGMAEIAPDTGVFLRVNKRLSEILGYEANELLNISLLNICHFEGNGDFLALADVGRGGGEYLRETQCDKKDGSSIWVILNAVLIHDENGLPLHAVITVDDVTEAREAETQIQNLSADLAHQERLNTMGEMAAGIAHELNQPLAAIAQNVDAALLTAAEHSSTPPEVIEILTEIEGQAHRAGDIIRALRGFVRKDEPSKTLINLAELIQHTVRLVHSEAKAGGVKITINSGNIPEIVGVRVQIAQVLVNLLRNAIESIATTKGANRREITVLANCVDPGKVELCVEDTGQGIDPEVNPFAQFETTKADGMGLGLSISQGIVEAHGGQLWHELSDRNEIRFCCSFPAEALS